MVVLDGAWDYLMLFGLATLLGGVGGLAYELTIGGHGRIEIPHRVEDGLFHDLGVWANVLLGAIVAPAALWVYAPEERTEVPATGAPFTVTEWNLVKVFGVSIIIGSAASAVLAAMQERALALVKVKEAAVETEKAEQTQKVAGGQLKALQENIDSGATPEQLAAQVESARVALRSIADSGPGNPDEEDF
jgi:hypothetical protein